MSGKKGFFIFTEICEIPKLGVWGGGGGGIPFYFFFGKNFIFLKMFLEAPITISIFFCEKYPSISVLVKYNP